MYIYFHARLCTNLARLWVSASLLLLGCTSSTIAQTGSLTGTASGVKSTSTTNLTAQGASDWAHWGQASSTGFDHKASGRSQISNVSVVGTGSQAQFTDSIQQMTWTDGTPTTSVTASPNGIWISGVGNGFTFTAPAGTQTQTLTVYVGGYQSGGTLTALLSDGSAPTYTDSSMSGSGTGTDGSHYFARYTFSYHAASVGQTIKLSWIENANQGSGNVTLQAATLLGAGGSLSGSGTAVTSTTSTNLTTQGTSDWAHWGQASATGYDHDSSGSSQISNITVVGSGTESQFTDSLQQMTWTNGSPTASATNTRNGVYILNTGNGFSFTAPADTTSRLLTVYVGGYNSGGTLTAQLSDGSALSYVDSSMSGASSAASYYATYTLTYHAASAAQTLSVSWVENSSGSASSSNVTLQAATLALAQGGTTATPSFSPVAGTYMNAQAVTISDATSGASIYYTTNGSIPTTSSTKYAGAITVSSNETVEAIATSPGDSTSAVGSATYTIAPVAATPSFSPAGGSFTGTQSVTLSDSTTGAAIYYTTNGSMPTTSSTLYSAPIKDSATETINAIAVLSGYTTSAEGSATYTITAATGPTQPTSFTASTTNFTGAATYCNVTLSWDASTDASGVNHYAVLRNGTTLTTTANLSYQDGTAASNTTYSYEVVAYDPSGNASSPSTPVSVGTGSCTAGQNFHLGVMYSSTQSTFSIWSPTNSSVVLVLNGTSYPMTLMSNPPNGYTNVYSVTVQGDHNGQTYNFQVGGVASCDPYGVMTQPGTCNDIVMDPSQVTLSAGWTPRPALVNRVDALVYEAHVREFTNDPSSGIPQADRGYFEGMTDPGTTVNGVAGDSSTGVAHLADMGVTHIQIMPFFDYNDCISSSAENTCFNWGYDPLNYNVPTSNYSKTPTNYTNRVLEVKQMVDNFHKQGIRVVMDVVYNHTTNQNVFGNITSQYYLSSDITGTGNTIDGSNPMVARMIQDSLEYWVTEYGVDGFRFDLLGVFPLATVNQWGTYLTTLYPDRNLLLYGEPWVDGTPASTAFNLGDIGTIPSSHVGAFNGAYRGALKGTDDNGGGNTGFLFNQSTNDSFFGVYQSGQTWPGNGQAGYGPISLGFAASPVSALPATANSNVFAPAFSAAPEQSINYVSVHDNLCLLDKITAWQSANGQTGQSLTNALIAYAFGMILSPEGIPFIYEGDEFQHSKNGNSNSDTQEYDLVWSSLQTNANDAATYTYVKGLIALRKAHPSLRFTTWSAVNTNVRPDQTSASMVITTINASAAPNETWKQAVIVYNSNSSSQQISLPSGSGIWYVAAFGQTIEPSGTTATGVAGSNSTPTVPAQGITIFYQ